MIDHNIAIVVNGHCNFNGVVYKHGLIIIIMFISSWCIIHYNHTLYHGVSYIIIMVS